jgi:hypothetical protein
MDSLLPVISDWIHAMFVESREVTIIRNTWGSRGNFLGISSRAVDLTMRPYDYRLTNEGVCHKATCNWSLGICHKTACIQSLGVCHKTTCIQLLGVCRKAAGILLLGVWCIKSILMNTKCWNICSFSTDNKWRHVWCTSLWDLTISGWPHKWINITWQCFKYYYMYLITWCLSQSYV